MLKGAWGFFCCLLFVTGLAAGSLPRPAQAVPEGELPVVFDRQIRPFFAEGFTAGNFTGSGGVTLRYAKRLVPQPRAVLVLLSGRTEFMAKYAELLYDLRDLPFSFFLYDHRGQGGSERLIAEHDKGYVHDFQDYVDDLSIFIETVVKPDGTRPLVVLSHSMGGLVAALYANGHPGRVQGLILCAPMLAINTAPLPSSAARLLAWGASRLGFGESYVPGGRPYDPAKPFSRNDVTLSQARFGLNQRLVANSPGDALGSPTFAWVRQAFAGMERLAGEHRQLTMPVLLLRAMDDTVVRVGAQAEFCRDLPDCTLVDMAGARHEILMEEDTPRNRALSLIRDFALRLAAPGKGLTP